MEKLQLSESQAIGSFGVVTPHDAVRRDGLRVRVFFFASNSRSCGAGRDAV